MPAAEPTIKTTDVTKRFKKTVALDGVSLAVSRGSVVALLGPNGAGKTTMIRVLATLYPPDEGTVTICGIDAAKQPARVRQVIGVTGQFTAVDPILTARENLHLVGRLGHSPRELVRERTDYLLGELGLADVADNRVRTYSGGMKRRLDLAGSLLRRPPVLILDEPTTGLDPQSRLVIWREVRSLAASGTTVLLSTQQLDEAEQLASDVVFLNRGRVVGAGTPNDLRERAGAKRLVLYTPDPEMARRAGQALRAHGRLAELAEDEAHLTLELTNGAGNRPDAVVAGLEGDGVVISGYTVRQPTLAEVFLAVTGQPVPGESKPTKEMNK